MAKDVKNNPLPNNLTMPTTTQQDSFFSTVSTKRSSVLMLSTKRLRGVYEVYKLLSNLDRTNFNHIIAMYVVKSSYLNHSMIMIIFTYTKHKKKQSILFTHLLGDHISSYSNINKIMPNSRFSKSLRHLENLLCNS